VLNVGLCDNNVESFARKTNERFAYDSYRRLLQMFGDVVVKELDNSDFEKQLDDLKREKGIVNDVELDEHAMVELVKRYKQVYEAKGLTFPQDPYEQLHLAIRAVFDSWENPRAQRYRQLNNITGLLGTAVNCQSMAFGNKGKTSGTGVLFTRDPASGEAQIYGEYLPEAQGEDVVAGIRTPDPFDTLKKEHPEVHSQLLHICSRLEHFYKDMQDVEFTVEEGTLYMLQCRSAKRTGVSAIRCAVEMCNEGLISKDDAIERITSQHLEQMLHPQLSEPEQHASKLHKGLNASPGAAVGKIVLSSSEAEKRGRSGEKVVLVRIETAADDIGGMYASEGILTARGGMTSHASVVARSIGTPAVVGVSAMTVDEEDRTVTISLPDGGSKTLKENTVISIDGTSGNFYAGEVPVVKPKEEGVLKEFMEWVDERRTLHVKANADEPESAQKAQQNGAQGIGLTRTEHMFFKDHERLSEMQAMILADSEEERKKSLSKLHEYQRSDFKAMFKTMDGLPVCIRLLDPPLNEFIPQGDGFDKLAESLSQRWNISESEVSGRAQKLQESNPMMGLRGCRLGIQFPEITKAQASAIIEAAKDAQKDGCSPHPEIMVPLVSFPGELENQRAVIEEVAKGSGVQYKVGTMLETPRAAMDAETIAQHADFFSVGSNDLTQFGDGLSRDDGGRMIRKYLDNGILAHDPFQVLDQSGVGELIRTAFERGRKGNPQLILGLCTPSSLFMLLSRDAPVCTQCR
jgi:pyruvate,orthophosphate dikinase